MILSEILLAASLNFFAVAGSLSDVRHSSPLDRAEACRLSVEVDSFGQLPKKAP